MRTSDLPRPGGIVVPKENSQAFIMMLSRGRAKVWVGEELSVHPCSANVRPELYPRTHVKESAMVTCCNPLLGGRDTQVFELPGHWPSLLSEL